MKKLILLALLASSYLVSADEINKMATIDVYCQDLKETYRLKNGFTEGLVFAIHNKEFHNWRLDYK